MTRPYCQTCARRHGIQLWEQACVCSGHVQLGSHPPGRSRYPDFTSTPKTTVTTETGPKIGKKESERLAKAMGRKP